MKTQITAFFMAGAYYLSRLLFQFGVENNSALVYVLAVTFVSWLTTGYFYGILASLFSSFCINYYFMYPYSAFSLSYAGYPVAMLSMTAIAIIICTLTSRIKLQALEAEQREQNTKALYELNERLNQEKNAIQLEAARETIRSNILRSVSHDLRTPLTAISGAAAVLLSSEEPRSEKDVSLLNDIKNDAEALTTMVENLLSITRLDGDIKLIKTPIALDELIDSVLIKFAKRYPDQEVEVNLPDELVIIPMDAILIEQVIINILENAVQHAEGMKKLALNVKCDGDRVVFEVQDDGDGIPEDRLKHLFDGSLLGDSSDEVSVDCRQRRNAGIGLSVCATIIKAHGGDISAYNSAEGGAVFRFTLKIEEVTDEQ